MERDCHGEAIPINVTAQDEYAVRCQQQSKKKQKKTACLKTSAPYFSSLDRIMYILLYIETVQEYAGMKVTTIRYRLGASNCSTVNH